MAWESGNAELFKKNSKFDSFLKRTLPNEVFEKVRAYESCIVVSENENKTFKYVVLSDEKLYLTENPPKVLKEVVCLKDIVSVDLVNEYPEFLGGEEKINTQHIAITYMTSEPKRRSFRRAKKSPRGSQTELGESRSNASTPVSYVSSIDGSFVEDLGSLTQSMTSIPRSSSWGSMKTGMPKKKRKPIGLNDSLDHGNILRSLKEEMEEDVKEDNEKEKLIVLKSTVQSNTGLGNSPARPGNRSVLASSDTGQNVKNRADSDRKLAGDRFLVKNSAVSSSQQSVRSLPPLLVTKASFSESEIRKFLGTSEKKEVEIVDIKGCCSLIRSYRKQKNQVAPTLTNTVRKLEPLYQAHKGEGLPSIHSPITARSQLSGQYGSLGSRSSLIRSSNTGTLPQDVEYNLNEFNTSFSDLGQSSSLLSVSGVTERRKCVLNIYLLNLDSPLLYFISSAWNNYMIRSTLALVPEQFEITTDPAALTKSTRDRVERKYNQIKRDLLQPELSLEEQYALIDHLCSTTKSNFTFKKLFWRNSDMLAFFIAQLQKYLPKSSAVLNTDEGKVQRADEIELSILILTTISLMLRETEVLPYRMQILKLEGGKLVSDLLKILMFQPEFPYRPLTLMKHWSAAVSENRKLHSDRNVDEELARLKTEYLHISICSVFELILVAKQVPAEETSILTVAGMTSLFHEMKALEKFMDCLLSQIMELVTLSRFDLLSPVQVLLVFQMFYLLLTFLGQSKAVVCYVCNNYYEEFKYFIQAPAVSRKLPAHYPLTPVTVSIIDQTISNQDLLTHCQQENMHTIIHRKRWRWLGRVLQMNNNFITKTVKW